MASHSLGLSLHEAARRMGVPFVEENEPVDRFVDANGLRFPLPRMGQPGQPDGAYAARGFATGA